MGEKPKSLHSAVKSGNKEVVVSVLARCTPKTVNKKDKDGVTALHIAAQNGKAEIAKLLIERGASVDVEENNGRTPLHLASAYGQRELVELLVREGADVLKADVAGMKAIDCICCGVVDKRQRHTISGLLSLAEMNVQTHASNLSVEQGSATLQSILRRRLSINDDCGSPTTTDTSASNPPPVFIKAGDVAYGYLDVNSDALVDIYDGSSFLNEDVRHSASHLRVREPLPGHHNKDIPYVNAFGN